MLEDSEIIALYFERNERAISETESKYGALCRSISVRIVGDSRDAEECVSDTYLKVWNSIPPQKPDSLAAFLSKIVRNLSLDVFRRKGAQKRGGDEDIPFEELSECIPDRAEEAENDAVREVLEKFLETLPKEQRVFFMRRYYFGEPLAEIAARYGVSANSLGVTMHRLRKRFGKMLTDSGVYGVGRESR
ncbi:RNA polymerase sigma-70 factor, ECF subfamily [Ruminococcus sp. YE71]|uniref:RNA polymerase sigma factor n=1 Tax=unclassified Ruminococcus TaxID=2608920 RepID=UPI000884E8F4|nr:MULTISPECIES: sigma-70 family RNA polymerase sigma factor [unclassified Ruminococcus]SDA12207.1 RNA polymerase sigma-70 factor, ECF subfamily [Ruminococcus sp. YE78]SFW16543.1 RNA polymerase sigma-70 factor, ECF subfamily [Ruminococcus sp. YE71]